MLLHCNVAPLQITTAPVNPAPQADLVNPVAIKRLTFLLLVGGVTYWFFDLIAPFLMPVFWAVVLAIVFHPLHGRLEQKMPDKPGLSATLTTLIIMFAVVIPVTLVALAAINEASVLVGRFNNGELDPTMAISWLESQIPVARDFLESYGINFDEVRARVQQGVATLGQWSANQALNIGQNFLAIGVDFFLMLYVLWFFLRDSEKIINAIIKALPLGDQHEWALLNRFASVSRATLKGTLIVAVTQGSLGGLLFWALGIDGALFWGVLMILLSLLPVGGSAIVWVPAAVIMAIQGNYVDAIIIVAFGALAIGLVDNFLRPLLVGRDTQMPDYLVLIATLGGITAFGLAGFVIGPVVAALFLTVWEMMTKEVEEQKTSVQESA